MPTQYDSDTDRSDDHDSGNSAREISLGTGTVLAIFLALAVVCSLFFGLGYSMGKKSIPLTQVAAAASPSSGSPSSLRNPSASRPDLQVVQPLEESSGPAAAETGPNRATDRATDRFPTAKSTSRDYATPLKPVPTAVEAVAPSTANAGPQSFVQVAAVSRKEDADLLLTALKHRGYTGLLRQQPQDKLLHIQVGPFATKKDAELMRQRLIVDGYNPILK